MTACIIDASVAIKWVVAEDGSTEAVTVLKRGGLIAPGLIISECANILWKKQRRGELTKDEALMAARLLEQAELELVPTRTLLASATALAIEIDHPAYDCLYLALALERGRHFITADERLIRKLAQQKSKRLSGLALSLTEFANQKEPL